MSIENVLFHISKHNWGWSHRVRISEVLKSDQRPIREVLSNAPESYLQDVNRYYLQNFLNTCGINDRNRPVRSQGSQLPACSGLLFKISWSHQNEVNHISRHHHCFEVHFFTLQHSRYYKEWYSLNEFKSFRRIIYNFSHVTSSPLFPQSNGHAERTVQTVKRLLKESTDPYKAMLSYRSTPIPWCNLSPTQLLMGRQVRMT